MLKISDTASTFHQHPVSPLDATNNLKSSLKRPREDSTVDESEIRTLQQQVLNECFQQLSSISEKPKKVKLLNGTDGSDPSFVNSDKENGALDNTENNQHHILQESKPTERERKRFEKEEEKRKKAAAKAEKEAAKQAKQLQKEEERKRKEEEKKKKEEEKKKKEEEKKRREEEKRQKEEEKRQRELEKEQERLRKENEKKQKEEEKKLKQLEKEKAKEEKRKKQEEEEERRKREETKQKSIINFGFVTVKKATKPEDSDWDKWYKPYQIPAGATVAPHIRVQSLTATEMDELLSKGGNIVEFLIEFKKKVAEKRSVLPKIQAPHEEDRDIPNESFPKRKMKLLLFHDNVRPAYFGTFSKVSKIIRGRKPFAEDKELLDYDFDSDAEWEDVSEGEDVDKSDADEEEEPEKDPNDPDNEEEEFVVPDNYLSDDEGIKEEADMMMLSSGSHSKEEKRKKLLELSKLQNPQSVSDVAPKSITGPVFDVAPGDLNYEKLKMYKMIPFLPLPVDPTAEINEPEINNAASPKKRGRFPEEAIPQLLEIVHGSSLGMEKLVAEMQTRFPSISELQIKKKIKEVAVKEKREGGKSAWYVHQNLLNPSQHQDMPQPLVFPNLQAPSNMVTIPPLSSITQTNFVQQPAVSQIVLPQLHSVAPQPKVPQQILPVLPFVPSTTPIIAPPAAKPVHVLQIKRAPKPVPSSPAKPIQSFFSNSPSTNNDNSPTITHPTPMATEPSQPLSTGLAIDLNDASSDNIME